MEDRIKNIFRLGFYIMFGFVPFVLSSCINESDVIADGDVSKAVVNLTFNIERQTNVTRSLSSSDDSENRIDSIAILIFNKGGNLIGNIFETYSTSKTSSFSVSVPCRVSDSCTVCAVANAPETLFTDVNTLAGFNDLYTVITTANDLGNSNHIVMFGKNTDVSVTSGGISTSISLMRLAAKVTFNITTSNGFVVTGYRLCHVPMSSRVIKSDSSDYNPSGVYGDLDKVTGLSVSSVNPVFYMYENLAGTKTGAMSFAERNVSNAAAKASYVVIDTRDTTTSDLYSYTVYLGGTSNDDYTNYNILRNYVYTYTINILGADTIDVRVKKIEPQIGDIYYSDGTWSSTLEKTKKPVGIVFSTTTSTTDYNNGFTHGYVMALKNAASVVAWCTSSAAYYQTQLQTTLTNTVALEESNWDGLTETNVIRGVSDYNQTNYPACYYAINYSAVLPLSGTSGWYLPSIGQWYLIVKNLGGVTTAPTLSSTSTPNYGYWTNTTKDFSISTASAINTYLNKAGSSNVEMIDCNLSTTRWYWCSSECSSVYASIMGFDSGGSLYLNYTYKTYTITNNRVRAVLAF
jgi:hypothetical protein